MKKVYKGGFRFCFNKREWQLGSALVGKFKGGRGPSKSRNASGEWGRVSVTFIYLEGCGNCLPNASVFQFWMFCESTQKLLFKVEYHLYKIINSGCHFCVWYWHKISGDQTPSLLAIFCPALRRFSCSPLPFCVLLVHGMRKQETQDHLG
jgi:hypothetical protein